MKSYLSLLLFIFLMSADSFAQVKLALNWKAETEFGGFYEALRTGLYQDVKVEILEGGSGTPTPQMLVGGSVEYAIVSAEDVILSADRDPSRRLVAVFTVFESSPYMIMGHKSLEAKTLEQVFKDSGQIISLQKGLPYVHFLLAKYAPIKAQIVPYTGGISLFESNPKLSQQGFITSEAVWAEQAKLKVKTWMVSDEGFNPYITVLAVRADYLKKNLPQVKKMVEATRKGWQNYLANPSATNQLMSQKNPTMSPALLDLSLAKMKPLMNFQPLKLGQMKLERWQQLQKQMTDLKLVHTPVNTAELFQTF